MRAKRFVAGTLLSGIVLLGAGLAAYAAGYRFNETESLPRGVWRLYGDAGSVQRGSIVWLCPPDTAAMRDARERGYIRGGFCPADFEPFLKPVAAIAGDRVSIDDDGIAVNGERLRNSRALSADGRGDALPRIAHGEYQVAPGTVWLVSTYTPWSFDSRYLGPIDAGRISAKARPVWIEGTMP